MSNKVKKNKVFPAEKHNRKCNGFNGFNGNCIGFNGNYNGVYWYVMILLVGCQILLEKCPKHTIKRNFIMVLLEKANGS